MNESRASGELEGSTLGSSSRDGDNRIGGRNHSRRTQSSGGFLLDSSFMPRSSKSLKVNHRPRRSEPDRKEKRSAPDPEIVTPKKKSRFPWIRHKDTQGVSSSTAAAAPSAAQETPSPSQAHQERDSHDAQATENVQQTDIGLDEDSIQIVKLALNLSESRKKGSLGRSASNRVSGRWAAPGPSPVTTHAPIAVGQRTSQGHRNLAQAFNDEHDTQPVENEPTPVSSLLPNTADDNAMYHFSDSTLARAEKARRHFELLSEYLRLLPSLPPLKQHTIENDADSTSIPTSRAHPHRVYNPLQSIRNRKVRFREKCPINAEAEGWDNVGKVHKWVDSVRGQHGGQNHSPFECLDLPTFERGEGQTSPNELEDVDMVPGSPPSSLRRVSRTGSMKARRPRFDWAISPAELLSDAAWTEEVQNKSKIVDKDGNQVYTDPTELVSADANVETVQNSANRFSLGTGQPMSHTSFSDSQSSAIRGRATKKLGRGRQRSRYKSPSNAAKSSSVSTKDTDIRHPKQRMRSISSSNVSMSDDRYSFDRSSRSYWSPRMERESPKVSGNTRLPSPHTSRMKGPSPLPEEDSNTELNNIPAQSSGPPSYRSGQGIFGGKRASMSSVGSLEDPYIPRMSLDPTDSTAPNSPAHPGYFPSIAVNLSPPSSRSPSPSKRAFPKRIVHRHERNKSKSGAKELRERADDSSLDNDILRKHTSPGLSDTQDRAAKLEPSPLPDRVSSIHEDQTAYEARKGGSHQESRFRGIFKGPGKIAGKVGNEVSKMGDFIMKKDSHIHSRHSSFATSDSSDDSSTDDADDVKGDRKSGPKALFRHFPAFSEDNNRLSRKDTEKPAAKGSGPLLSNFTSPSRQDDRVEQQVLSEVGSPRERGKDSKTKVPDTDTSILSRSAGNKPVEDSYPGNALWGIRTQAKKSQIKDASVPFSLTRPPVTGLAQARASPVPSARDKRPDLSGTSRSWSISNRSVLTLADSGVPDKREVERTRALLLSSGIKAREITRRAETVRNPPSDTPQTALSSNSSIPRVTRLCEYDLAAQSLMQQFERTHYLFTQSMDRFPTGTSSPLKSHLSSLEALVEQSLTPRVQAAAADAEQLSVQLNTTSTLAVKQLSDTLDKGLRRRRRRLRWLRRAGFFMLEWALVGMLWWVWLVVMIFKVFRGVFRGALSGVRWVFWL